MSITINDLKEIYPTTTEFIKNSTLKLWRTNKYNTAWQYNISGFGKKITFEIQIGGFNFYHIEIDGHDLYDMDEFNEVLYIIQSELIRHTNVDYDFVDEVIDTMFYLMSKGYSNNIDGEINVVKNRGY